MSKGREITSRVGVLVVHGIGEQRRFEHLVEVAKNIALALKADEESGPLDIQIELNLSSHAAFLAEHESWATDNPPVKILARDTLKNVTEISFHETWWADLGEPTNLKTIFKFWYWGLSLWMNPGYLRNSILEINNKKTSYPGDSIKEQKISWIVRLILFGVSLIIFLIMPILATLNRVLSWSMGLSIRLDIISQYLSRVKIFQQSQHVYKKLHVDFGLPPRVAIRRRMVTDLIEMWRQDYDRWYILAHSQGTVLAFNGLMEIEQALPNYLSEETWLKIKNDLGKISQSNEDNALGVMMPQRPFWLNKKDLINREKLFANLQGFLTYGSPLSKFAVLWPAIVRLNNSRAFSDQFEWINIYDPTDPVAGKVNPTFCTNSNTFPKNPQDIAYKSDSFHLFSHITYLNFNKNKTDRLVNRVASWLLRGGKFESPSKIKKKWQTRSWFISQLIAWVLLCVIAAIIVSFIIKLIVQLLCILFAKGICSKLPNLIINAPSNFWIYIIFSAATVLLAGFLEVLKTQCERQNLYFSKASIKDYFRQNANKIVKKDEIYEIFDQLFKKSTIDITLNQLTYNANSKQNIRKPFLRMSDESNFYWFPTLKVEIPKQNEILKASLTPERVEELCKVFDRVVRHNPSEGSSFHFCAPNELALNFMSHDKQSIPSLWIISLENFHVFYILYLNEKQKRNDDLISENEIVLLLVQDGPYMGTTT